MKFRRDGDECAGRSFADCGDRFKRNMQAGEKRLKFPYISGSARIEETYRAGGFNAAFQLRAVSDENVVEVPSDQFSFLLQCEAKLAEAGSDVCGKHEGNAPAPPVMCRQREDGEFHQGQLLLAVEYR